MNSSALCDVCGNEVDITAAQCPFCGAARKAASRKGESPSCRTVNLEKGLPLVSDALERLKKEIQTSRLQGFRALLVIHGYGSSGKGGAIKKEVRKLLDHLKDRKEIHDFLPGENCGKRFGTFRQTVKRFPFLEKYISKTNPGITLIIL